MSYELKIGNLKFDNPLVSAPLAGISDIGFRVLCKKYGASLTYSEMISSDALVRQNESTIKMARIATERPIAIQLFGTNIDNIIASVQWLSKNVKPDIIDFNFGCPAKDIMKQGAGSALLKDPKKMYDIVKAMTSATKIPITTKMRVGITSKDNYHVKIAKMLEEAGSKAIIVHGRDAAQGYSGTANWDKIKDIKNAVKIPVVGNGDICDPITAKKYLDEKYCDGLMIGRASLGNPRIFEQIKKFLLNNEKIPNTTWEEKLNDFLEYVKIAQKNDDFIFARAKMHAQFFTKGWKNAASVRRDLSLSKNIEEVITLFENYKTRNENIE